MLLKDEVQFETKYYKYVPEEPDTEELVFTEGGKIKYHLSPDCTFISKDFLDFIIPEEIQKLGSKAVWEYRDWFKGRKFKEKYTIGEIRTTFINREFNRKYCEKYGIKPIDENSGILVLDKKNTNVKTIDYSFDMITFKKELTQLLNDYADKFRVSEAQRVAKHSYLFKESDAVILNKLKEILPKTPITDKNFPRIVDDLHFARKIIVQILNLLKGYLKWTYGLPNKDFDKITLEHFGLECCQSCGGKK
jgi:hypothetical protein